MGKLEDRLNRQLKTENKKEAEDCLKLFNWVKDTDPEGKVWSSRWTPLVDVRFEGWNKRIYKPNITGYTILKSLKNK